MYILLIRLYSFSLHIYIQDEQFIGYRLACRPPGRVIVTQEAARRHPGDNQQTPKAPEAPEDEIQTTLNYNAKAQLFVQIHREFLRVGVLRSDFHMDECSWAAVAEPAHLARPPTQDCENP